jgi:hypothetical protein
MVQTSVLARDIEMLDSACGVSKLGRAPDQRFDIVAS